MGYSGYSTEIEINANVMVKVAVFLLAKAKNTVITLQHLSMQSYYYQVMEQVGV